MKHIVTVIAQLVGYFPRIVVGILILMAILLTISTLAYVSQTQGLGLIIELSRQSALYLMAGLILLIYISLGLRITYINKYLKKRVYAIARVNQRGHSASNHTEHEDRRQARLLLLEINFRGNILKKLATAITWHAELFTVLLVFLGGLYAFILWSYYRECDFGRNCQDIDHSWLWRSAPWLSVGLIIMYLTINDWFVMQAIYKFLRNLLYLSEIRRTAFHTQKVKKLTPTEQIVYTKRIQEGKRLKEIADEMNVSVGTVKTHINNIGKKLQTAEEAGRSSEAY